MAKQFNDDAISRIARTVKEFERREHGGRPGKRFDFLGGGGSVDLAFFILDSLLPACGYSDDVFSPGQVLAQKMTWNESGQLVKEYKEDGATPQRETIYNLSNLPIHIVDDELDECEVSMKPKKPQLILAFKNNDRWIVQHPGTYEFEEISVATNITLSDTELKTIRRKVMVITSDDDCDSTEILTTTCS